MAEAPVTAHAASSPTAHSWSSRARRCRHHLASLIRTLPVAQSTAENPAHGSNTAQPWDAAGGREGSRCEAARDATSEAYSPYVQMGPYRPWRRRARRVQMRGGEGCDERGVLSVR